MEQYKLYGGKVVLNFDEKRHIYSVGKKKAWGTTSIIGVLDKPALLYWVANQTIGFIEKTLVPGKSLDELEIKWMLDEAKKAFRVRRDKAADIGTLVHEWLERYIKAGVNKEKLPALPTNKEMRHCLKGFFDWVKDNKVKFIASEQKIYSKKYNYAGTFDASAIVNGKRTIIDFKTGKGLYPEMKLQATAYLMAKEEEEKKTYPGGVILLRLSKENKEKRIESFEAQQVQRKDLTNGLFDIFLACLKIYGWKQSLKKYK